jgi:hypothetical protein
MVLLSGVRRVQRPAKRIDRILLRSNGDPRRGGKLEAMVCAGLDMQFRRHSRVDQSACVLNIFLNE